MERGHHCVEETKQKKRIKKGLDQMKKQIKMKIFQLFFPPFVFDLNKKKIKIVLRSLRLI